MLMRKKLYGRVSWFYGIKSIRCQAVLFCRSRFLECSLLQSLVSLRLSPPRATVIFSRVIWGSLITLLYDRRGASANQLLRLESFSFFLTAKLLVAQSVITGCRGMEWPWFVQTEVDHRTKPALIRPWSGPNRASIKHWSGPDPDPIWPRSVGPGPGLLWQRRSVPALSEGRSEAVGLGPRVRHTHCSLDGQRAVRHAVCAKPLTLCQYYHIIHTHTHTHTHTTHTYTRTHTHTK